MTDEETTECRCPVCRQGDIPTLPLGVSFADKIRVEGVSQHIARDIYTAHHSYLPSTPNVNLAHHGVFLDEYLVGCITYRHPLIRKLDDYGGSEIVEVARICVAVDMPNLASAGFSKSQDRFVSDYASSNAIRILITFVREDYQGSMVAALKSKGWKNTGTRKAKQAGNREHTEIRDRDKDRWICELDTPVNAMTQQTLAVANGGVAD